MKKLLAMLMVLVMLFSVVTVFTGCDSDSSYSEEEEDDEDKADKDDKGNGDKDDDSADAEKDLPASAEEAVIYCIDGFCNGKKENMKGSVPSEVWDYYEREGYSYQIIYDNYDAWYADYLSYFEDGFHVDATVTATEPATEDLKAEVVADLTERLDLDTSKLTAVVVPQGTMKNGSQEESLTGAVICYDGVWYWCDEGENGKWVFVMENAIQQNIDLMGNACGSDNVSGEGGCEVGDYYPYTDVITLSADGVSGVTTTQTDRVAVFNFWGTWCGPCLNELPHFDKAATEYADQIYVFAIHSTAGSENVSEFIASNYPDSNIYFALEQDSNDPYYTEMGGQGYYPYTVVVNANGVITHKFTGAIDYDTLSNAIEEALNN